MQVWINGCSGRMGKILVKLLQVDSRFHWQGGTTSAGNFDNRGKETHPADLDIDLVIDFSTPTANKKLSRMLRQKEIKTKGVLIATTGLPETVLDEWRALAAAKKLRVLFAPNTSIGIAFLTATVLKAISHLGPDFDIELSESHHRGKKDAPSGTANYITERICEQYPHYFVNPSRRGPRQENEIGIHAVRGGNVFGEHTVSFLGQDEEVIVTHRALSRDLFGKGALALSLWLWQKDIGFYSLRDVTV